MTWIFKRRGEDSQVRRTFACGDCGLQWVLWQDRDEAPPDCPVCSTQAAAAVQAPALLSNKSKALDIAEDTMRSMGLTDMNDNLRTGDVAYKAESGPTTSERDALGQQTAELVREMNIPLPKLSEAPQAPGGLSQKDMGSGFWGGGGGLGGEQMKTLTAAANVGAQQARAEGVDPINLLHKDRRGVPLDVIASDRPKRERAKR